MGLYNRVTGSAGNETRIKGPKPFKPIELDQAFGGAYRSYKVNERPKIDVDTFFNRIEKRLQSVSWILVEFYFNRGLQRLYTGTCIILQKTINGFLCLLIVFLKSKTYQLILKDVIKLNRNLR